MFTFLALFISLGILLLYYFPNLHLIALLCSKSPSYCFIMFQISILLLYYVPNLHRTAVCCANSFCGVAVILIYVLSHILACSQYYIVTVLCSQYLLCYSDVFTITILLRCCVHNICIATVLCSQYLPCYGAVFTISTLLWCCVHNTYIDTVLCTQYLH